MKITDQQLCIYGLLILAGGALIGSGLVDVNNQSIMITIATSVVSGLLGYLKGKE